MNRIEKQAGYFESFDGHPIYYESRGKGETIVFVYGIACLMNHWHFQIDYFSKNFRTIILDFRGHHKTKTPKDKATLSIESLAKDLKILLKSLKISQAHFIAHSFGAQVVLKLYDQDPKLFKSLAFINGFARNPIKEMFGLGLVEKLYHFIKISYGENPALWKTLWKLSVESPFAVPFTSLAGGFNLKLTNLKDIQVYAKGVANMDLNVFLIFFEELMNYDGTSVLNKIKCPTLIISGENDRVTPLKFQKEMSRRISESQLLIVPYGSHCTQLDFPDYINLRIEKFLAEVLNKA